MTIDPEYQRQGAGRALLTWGTDIADDLGIDVSAIFSHKCLTFLTSKKGHRRGDRLR